MISRRKMLQATIGALAGWLFRGCAPEAVMPPSVMLEPEPMDTALPETANPTAMATVVPATPVPACPTEILLPNSATHIFNTVSVKREYKILVATPMSYHHTTRTYPVLYALDANASFVMMTEIARLLFDQRVIPEIIVVGVAYNVSTAEEWGALRIRDYTPSYMDQALDIPGGYSSPTSGGASTFLNLIREEIKPFIEEHYRADPQDAGVYGHSLGGLFGLYALFQEPDTFQRYILSSPSIWWDDKVIFEFERKYAENHGDLAARVHMAIGQQEGLGVVDVQDLAHTLEERQYPGLILNTTVFADEDHGTVIPVEMNRGLRMVYPLET